MAVERVSLVGNPNSGKSSLFNHLTGLNQHVGNYPGVTVDKKEGFCLLEKGKRISLIDLPGCYSIYPRSEDERIVQSILTSPGLKEYPDLTLVIVDASNLERSLLIYTQVYDLGLPIILVPTMIDVADNEGIDIDFKKLAEVLGCVTICPVNARTGEGIEALKKAMLAYGNSHHSQPFIAIDDFKQTADKTRLLAGSYRPNGKSNGQSTDNAFVPLFFDDPVTQGIETEIRYKKIRRLLGFVISKKQKKSTYSHLTRKIDALVTHPVWGYIIFAGILTLIFQAIYSFAEWPMNLIDDVFFSFSYTVKNWLPAGIFTDLLAEGIIPGVGGVVIFIPQIALLFAFIAILEETGYMSRVVFIMDKLMRPFGLNGKSVVPLISGVACAIPAIMATRSIDQWKDRLITILVTPLMSCSARLPVYTLLIALVIPDIAIGGIFNLKGLVLLGLYLLGLIAALGVAILLKWIIKAKQKSFLIMELPMYKMPRWRNILLTILEKTKVFVWEAGKVILAISIVLWVLASYGPAKRIENAVNSIPKPPVEEGLAWEDYQKQLNTVKLENSWIGILGKTIEPVIAPLGYDWKIGIALITSFAAREVFVGSMATIYSIGEDFEENDSLIDRMRTEINPATGQLVYSLGTGVSLMVFYAFAMQCMSTLAIVLRETKNWKWPLIQTAYMTLLAYLAAWLTYYLLK